MEGKLDVAALHAIELKIESIFSSSQSISGAFGVTALDTDLLESIYQSLMHLYSCDIKKHLIIRSLFRAHLRLVAELSVQGGHIDEAYMLLSLFQSPVLMIESKAKELLPKLASLMSRKSRTRGLVVTAWTLYPLEIISRILYSLQRHISSELLRERRLTPSIMAVIRVMSKVYQANQMRTTDTIPCESFYNSVVSDKLDVMDHYLAWRQQEISPSMKEAPFSFCEFPFLLSAQAKSRLLQAEAKLSMDEAVAHSQNQYRLYGCSQCQPLSSVLPSKPKETVLQSNQEASTSSHQGSRFFASNFFSFLRRPRQMKSSASDDPFTLPSPENCSVSPTHAECCVVRVRRTHLVEDSIDEISRQTQHDLRKPLKILFIGEEGVDAGGLKKEWFQLVIERLTDPHVGLMSHIEESKTLTFNPRSLEPDHHFQILGLIVGLGLYNNCLLDFPLAPPLYKKLLGSCEKSGGYGNGSNLIDFEVLHPTYGRGLRQLLDFKEGPGCSVEETFSLTFSLDILTQMGPETIELIPGGAQIPVTINNRQHFVSRVVSYHLDESIRSQFQHFSTGFKTIITGPVLQILDGFELEQMVCGAPNSFDFEALKGHTKYEGGYSESSLQIQWFWEVVGDFDMDQKRRLLLFFSGSDRSPIGGLARLRFIIQKNSDELRLPTAHTCFNSLLLPEYSSKGLLRERLLVAIDNAQGFGLK